MIISRWFIPFVRFTTNSFLLLLLLSSLSVHLTFFQFTRWQADKDSLIWKRETFVYYINWTENYIFSIWYRHNRQAFCDLWAMHEEWIYAINSKWSSNRTTSLFQLCYHHLLLLLFYWKPCMYSVYCVPCATFNIWIQPRDTWEISNHYSTLNKHLEHSIRFQIGKTSITAFIWNAVWKPCMWMYVDCFVFCSMTICRLLIFESKMCVAMFFGAMYSKLTFNKIIIYIWLCFVFTFVILWFH